MPQPFRFQLPTIVFLAFVLALSFLLVILSCALWSNWLPIVGALIFVLAPLPNILFYSSEYSSLDDYEYSSPATDFGRFLTSLFLVSGVAYPYVLAHSSIIHPLAAWMSGIGGALGYTTIIAYGHFFDGHQNSF